MSRRNDRAFRREESHRETHSQAQAAQAPLTRHPLASDKPPRLVTTPEDLAGMIDHLRSAGAFAFDSEFIGERSYVSFLCLAQVATTREVFLLDPLAGLDLSAFWALFPDASIEKLLLAGQQDLAPAALATGLPPAAIYDVQIAAGFTMPDYPISLTRLLQEFVGVPAGAPMAFTRWDNRPLTSVQVRYAADDVRYLPAARDAIDSRLASLGRAAWARQECAAALEDMALYRPPPEVLYLRVRGRDRLGPRALAALRELAAVRDQAARAENTPPRTLLKDGILCTLARRPIRSLADLDAIRGLPRPVELRYGQAIVDAIARAAALPPDQWPPAEPEESPALKDRVDTLWAEIARRCQEQSLAPTLVGSRRELVRLVQLATTGKSPDGHRFLQGWRGEFLGEILRKNL